MSTAIDVKTSTEVDPETDQDVDPDLDMEYDLYDETDMEVDTTPESYTLDSTLSSTPIELPEPDQESFCRPRTTEKTSDKIGENIVSLFTGSFNTDSFSWITALITFACIGGFILLVFLWYTLKYPELIGPFMVGFLRILWYLLIYSAIVSVMVLFVRFIAKVIYFIKVTIEYFNLTMNPLLNPKVSSLSCYFTDYVNSLIYYPAMIFYLICFIFLLLFDFLILLPVLAVFGFIIGFLFSLLGENRNTMGQVFGKVAGMVKSTVKGNPSSQGQSKTQTNSPGLMGKVASLAGATKGIGPLGALAGATGATGVLNGVNGLGSGSGSGILNQVASLVGENSSGMLKQGLNMIGSQK